MRPTYVPPGQDPTQIERDLPRGGCMKWLWLITGLIGLCAGFSLGNLAFSHAAPSATPTPYYSPTPGPSPTPTATPTITPTPGPITATPGDYAITPAPTNWACGTYIITRGDSLAAIALKYHVTLAALEKANKIANPNRVIIGQRIQVPCK